MNVGSVGHPNTLHVKSAHAKKAQVKPTPPKDSDGDHDGDKVPKANTATPPVAETSPDVHHLNVLA